MNIIHALSAGFLLDLSTVGYLIAAPLLLTVLYFIFKARWIAFLNDYFVYILILLYCLTSFGELCLYEEWKTKLNVQALLHFTHPAEVFQSATFKLTFLFFSLVICFTVFYVLLYNQKLALRKAEYFPAIILWKRFLVGFIMLLLFLTLDAMIIRGGLKPIPISESEAYYSPNRILNDAAVNPLWSLGHNIMEYNSHQKSNPYHVMPDEEADKIMGELFNTDFDSTEYILTTPKPNIVIIILESYSALTIPNFGGDSFALFIDSLSKQGIVFTNCYSSAYVSDQGIPAILSSYPSSPRMAITNQTSKSLNLPCLNKDLKQLGYNSGFYFGGQLNYGNIKSYLYNMHFDVVKEHKDFPAGMTEGKLGIHDKDMAKLFLKELNNSRPPFLKCWFTISSHSPYDIPEPLKPLINHRQNPYINTIVYTDNAIRGFFTEAKKQSWFKNTLFVIVADHSHENQKDIDFEHKDFHHIPLFFYGDVIKPELHGKKIEGVFSQLDIVPTLLHQFKLNSAQYLFGKNMLNPETKHFAFYYFFHGTGFVTDSCFASFGKDRKELLKTNCSDSLQLSSIKKMDEAFLQKEFEDYLSR